MDEPTNPSDPPPCERTRFLVALLDDDERGRLQPVERYLADFPAIADFVRTEYAALARPAGPAAQPATTPASPYGRAAAPGPPRPSAQRRAP